MITENLSTLKIHKLTQKQYDRELAAGRLDETALYLTPDEAPAYTEYADIPKLTTVNLHAANWTGDANPWSQVVTMNGITTNSKVDLQPTAIQIVELQNTDIALMAENDDGVVTVYALGNKPEKDYTIQALITEVTVI